MTVNDTSIQRQQNSESESDGRVIQTISTSNETSSSEASISTSEASNKEKKEKEIEKVVYSSDELEVSVVISLPSTESEEQEEEEEEVEPPKKRFAPMIESESESDSDSDIKLSSEEESYFNQKKPISGTGIIIPIDRSSAIKSIDRNSLVKPIERNSPIKAMERQSPSKPIERSSLIKERGRSISPRRETSPRRRSPVRRSPSPPIALNYEANEIASSIDQSRFYEADKPVARQISPEKLVKKQMSPQKDMVKQVPLKKPLNSLDASMKSAEFSAAIKEAFEKFNLSPLTSGQATPPIKKEPARTAYVYDKRMLLHHDIVDDGHPECPDRISSIHDHLRELGLLDRAERVPVIINNAELEADITRVHDTQYHQSILSTRYLQSPEEFKSAASEYNSVYFNQYSALSALVSAAATVQLCKSIASGKFENGFAITRPPGHHAEHDEAMGFCLYNNVAIAAASLLAGKLAKRILIVDWDVHHGNGTQNAFVDNPDVLYISLHRFDNGAFYPHIDEAGHTFVGVGKGVGK